MNNNLRRFGLGTLGIVFVSILPIERAAYAQVGTAVVTLSNASASCINVEKETVDFWILSARVPKKENWLTATNGVGARVDVRLTGQGQSSNFPAAAAINTRDLNGKIVRASLSLHVLDQYDLWNTGSMPPVQTTSISVPVSFVRRQGSSNAAKIAQTLIAFTNSAQATVPPNPYTQGAKLVGQLANSLLTALQPNSTDVVDPDFQLNFGLGRVNTGCQSVQLREGIGVQIADVNNGSMADGIIKTSDLANYCFYKIGTDEDPNVGFANKGSQACPAAVPQSVATLNNPQFIWLAYGTCKSGVGCTATPTLNRSDLAPLREMGAGRLAALLTSRSDSASSDFAQIQSAVQSGNPAAIRSRRAASHVRALALCKSVGVPAERCFDRRFAVPEP